MKRRVTKLTLAEKRSGIGSEGWPRCIKVEFSTGGVAEIILAPKNQYSQEREIVELINSALQS